MEGELRARLAELEELRGKVREAEEQLECTICMERAVTTVLKPVRALLAVTAPRPPTRAFFFCGWDLLYSCFTCLQPVAGKARLCLG